MYNPNTGETFPSNIKIDPKTAEELVKRKDDNEQSILKRIDEFMQNTLVTVEKQKLELGKVIEIDADNSIEDV
jgi:adenylate kinase family enzyme